MSCPRDERLCIAEIGPGERVVQSGQGAVIPPGGEVPVHRPPRREIGRQVPPGAPGPVHVQDRIGDRPQRPGTRPDPPPGHLRRQVPGRGPATGHRSDHWDSAGPAHSLGIRGPWCFSGLPTSGTRGPRPSISAGQHATTRASPPQTGILPIHQNSLSGEYRRHAHVRADPVGRLPNVATGHRKKSFLFHSPEISAESRDRIDAEQ